MKKIFSDQSGLIGILAVITVVAVTGGTLIAGVSIIDGVHKSGCGNALNSWRSGDIYADLADSDNLDVIDDAQRCQKAMHDAVQTSKPVGTLMSAASNIGGDYDNAATFVVDRIMDQVDAVSDPDHEVPTWTKFAYDQIPDDVRDLVFTDTQIKPFIEEESEVVVDEPVEIIEEVPEVPEVSEAEEVEEITEEIVVEKEVEEEVEEEMEEEIVVEVLDVEEDEGDYVDPGIGTHGASFSRPSTTVTSEQGVNVMINETTSGSITLIIQEDNSASCNLTLSSNFVMELGDYGSQEGSANGSARSCTGEYYPEYGTFYVSGIMSGTVGVAGQTGAEDGPFNVTGSIDEEGIMTGSIEIEGVPEIPFAE